MADLDSLSEAPNASATGEYYDKWASSYDKDLLSWGYAAPARIANLCKTHGIELDGRICDIGCGTGMSGEALHAAGFSRLAGADLSNESVQIIRAQKSAVYSLRAQVVNMEITPYPFFGEYFDAVTCVGTLSYFSGMEKFQKIFSEFVRLLKPGGLAIFTMREDLLLKSGVGFRDALKHLLDASQWSCVYESAPEDYLPKHPNEAERSWKIRSFVMQKPGVLYPEKEKPMQAARAVKPMKAIPAMKKPAKAMKAVLKKPAKAMKVTKAMKGK